MDKKMVAKELVGLARDLTAEVSRKSIEDGRRQFYQVQRALAEIKMSYEDYWSHGSAPDPVLDEMLQTSSELATKAEAMEKDLMRKMAKWEAEARRRV